MNFFMRAFTMEISSGGRLRLEQCSSFTGHRSVVEAPRIPEQACFRLHNPRLNLCQRNRRAARGTVGERPARWPASELSVHWGRSMESRLPATGTLSIGRSGAFTTHISLIISSRPMLWPRRRGTRQSLCVGLGKSFGQRRREQSCPPLRRIVTWFKWGRSEINDGEEHAVGLKAD